MASRLQRTPHTRLFLIENRAGPANAPSYQGFARAGSLDWPQGDITPVYLPSADNYDAFDVADTIVGQRGLPTLSTEFRKNRDISAVLKLIRKGCAVDLQIHGGACKDPTDFDRGWEWVTVLENARASSYGTSDLGAFDGDQNEAVLETIPWVGQDLFELKRLVPATIADSEITDPIVKVVICDKVSCGECGIESDGCQIVFALPAGVTGSPGLPNELLYTENGGTTWGTTQITSMALGDSAVTMACVGPYLVVAGDDSDLHYALIADILDGDETWTEIALDAAATAIFSAGRTYTWIIGQNGNIEFFADPTAVGENQTSGVATALTSIHGIDRYNLVVVGEENVVIYTQNGGDTWSAVTGPIPATNLTCVWMKNEREWFVGAANGNLYYTRDYGTTWATKTFPGSGSGEVKDIQFANQTVGYLSHTTTAGAGILLRTINGGNTWYTLPDDTGQLFPTLDELASIAACVDDPNVVFAGGTNANGSDGVLVKAS